MTGSYRYVRIETTVADAVSDAFSALQELRDEMREWADNMESGNLGSTPKFEEVSAAADALGGFADDEPEVPPGLEPRPVVAHESVNRRKGRGPSRAARRDSAVSLLRGVVNVLDGEEDDDATGLTDACQTAIDEADGVEFPSMF